MKGAGVWCWLTGGPRIRQIRIQTACEFVGIQESTSTYAVCSTRLPRVVSISFESRFLGDIGRSGGQQSKDSKRLEVVLGATVPRKKLECKVQAGPGR